MTAPRPRTPSLFAPAAPANDTGSATWITAHCDGGARGNPGPAGFGAEITDSTGGVLAELSEFLGVCTNNVAEYSGLLASLQYALDHGHPRLRVVSDSELMVKQIQGKYKVNSPDLKPLWQEAKNRIARLERFEITHALRHKNKAADRLANEAMDRGMNRGPQPDSGMKRNIPAEGRPSIRSGADTARVDSLPLRAIPYPAKVDAPPAPARLDPSPRIASPPSRPERTAPEERASAQPTRQPRHAPRLHPRRRHPHPRQPHPARRPLRQDHPRMTAESWIRPPSDPRNKLHLTPQEIVQ